MFSLSKTSLSLILMLFLYLAGSQTIFADSSDRKLYLDEFTLDYMLSGPEGEELELKSNFNGYKGFVTYQLGYLRHTDGLWYPSAAFETALPQDSAASSRTSSAAKKTYGQKKVKNGGRVDVILQEVKEALP